MTAESKCGGKEVRNESRGNPACVLGGSSSSRVLGHVPSQAEPWAWRRSAVSYPLANPLGKRGGEGDATRKAARNFSNRMPCSIYYKSHNTYGKCQAIPASLDGPVAEGDSRNSCRQLFRFANLRRGPLPYLYRRGIPVVLSRLPPQGNNPSTFVRLFGQYPQTAVFPADDRDRQCLRQATIRPFLLTSARGLLCC